MKKLIQIFFVLLLVFTGNAQDSAVRPVKLTINGYIKDLQSLSFDRSFKESLSGNFIHNRINIKWKPSEKVNVVAALRNRLFWGEMVKQDPYFKTRLRNENERLNLQKTWIETKSLVFHTNIERLYGEYRAKKWNMRVGRQRVNWGVTTTWNPNDIFNTYNFLDFDYEERPGVDAGKFQYSFGDTIYLELTYALIGSKRSIAAMKYSFSKSGYDMQFVTGWYKNRATVGAGWAGNIKDAGFKGEIQYFSPKRDSSGYLNAAVEADYMFSKGWYVNAGLLFRNSGLHEPVENWEAIDLKLSPENLMPTKWNIIISTARQFTPLFSMNTSVLYAPGTNLLILLPSIEYSPASNFDVNLIWQSFFSELDNKLRAVNHQCFFRVKWSF